MTRIPVILGTYDIRHRLKLTMDIVYSTLKHSKLPKESAMNTSMSPQIVVRHQQFSFSDLSLYYFKDNPLLSHLLTALSLTFPHGERFFVHSVRNVRGQVTDSQLQQDISGFIGQEALHSHYRALCAGEPRLSSWLAATSSTTVAVACPRGNGA